MYVTLDQIGGVQSEEQSDPKLLECFKRYFKIYIQEGRKRHKCTRRECARYCIMPMYARRCLSNITVLQLFRTFKSLIEKNPSLLPGNMNESKIALNVLKCIAKLRNAAIRDSYDTLLAMAGHHGMIFNPKCTVDSKLYGYLFDIFRDGKVSKITSFTLLDIITSECLEINIGQIERHLPELDLTEVTSSSTEYAIYFTIKKIRSFMNRNNLSGNTIEEVAANICEKWKDEDKDEVIKFVCPTLRRISQGDAEQNEPLNIDLYECLTTYLNMHIQDRSFGKVTHKMHKA